MEADNDKTERGRSVSEICEKSANAICLVGRVPGKGNSIRVSDIALFWIGGKKCVSLKCNYRFWSNFQVILHLISERLDINVGN